MQVAVGSSTDYNDFSSYHQEILEVPTEWTQYEFDLSANKVKQLELLFIM